MTDISRTLIKFLKQEVLNYTDCRLGFESFSRSVKRLTVNDPIHYWTDLVIRSNQLLRAVQYDQLLWELSGVDH